MNPLEPNAVAVGIDLGTTYTVVAQIDQFGQPQIIPNDENQRTTPSVIYADGNNVLVGSIAKEQTQISTAHTLQFIKPFMGRRTKRFALEDTEWTPEELSAMILRKVVQDAETAMGGGKKITHCVITVPAFFTEQQRKSTEDAGRIAGLQVMSIINEPTAAALAYGFDTLGTNKTVLVYDLGGGTFDVTVMRIEGDSVKMLATDGDVQLGGRDWDERIIDYVAENFESLHGADPREDPNTLQSLWTMAEQAKLRLSKLPSTTMSLTYKGHQESIEMSRGQFEEMTEDLLDQTETTLRLTVEEAGLLFGDIDECLLVGGSTRMRSVREMIGRIIGREPRHILNPDECVAHGAAIYAVMMQVRLRAKGIEVPEPKVHLEQLARFRQINEQLINAHTLGIMALGPENKPVVAPIIPRRAHIPRREVKTFHTARDGQPQIRIVVMEGESEKPEACAELGTCLIRGLPENLPRGTPIEVCFECTHDGRLGLTARLPTIDQAVQTHISRTMGMDEEQIQKTLVKLNGLRIE